MLKIIECIAQELNVSAKQVASAIQLLDEGATVPFIARYRKEVTDGLDDTHLRNLQERLIYLRELEERRETILKSISEQNKLTPELEQSIKEAQTKVRLEDLYLPYKPKRRTKGQIAIEAGLLPLADALFDNPALAPEEVALSYIDAEKGVNDIKGALEGARYILMERFAEDAELLGQCREYIQGNAQLKSVVVQEKISEAQKFQDYFDHIESFKSVRSHRALAMFRGRKEGFLQLSLVLPEELENPNSVPYPQNLIAKHFNIVDLKRAADPFLQEVVRFTWRVKVQTHLETELMGILREKAEEEAISVFKQNLHDLLMAPPAGAMTTLGLDPGIRTGVKVAAVDGTGKLLITHTIYPHPPKNQWQESIKILESIIASFDVKLISIGNGTASRETEKLVDELIAKNKHLTLTKVVISEAGASVYSASEMAAKEFPNLDVSLRGAVSIARRLQDPLAELVKIDPKSIGVGQYQHDVNQTKLARTLEAVVEDAVNAVGVDVNTASVSLLTFVAGLNQQIAQKIIEYRDQNGRFTNRDQLKQVPRLGNKAFEQAAGFLRISQGDNPLDASGVHPESYPVIEKLLTESKRSIHDIIGNGSFLHTLDPKAFVTDKFGLPTVKDILKELEKPGRDPRAEFQTVKFKEGVESVTDLKEGMILEGVVTNVANFGAFVDIGVHQDGLVHISELSTQYISDPRTVVKTGQIVRVRVLGIDKVRQRISLSLRLDNKQSSPPESSSNRSSSAQKSAMKKSQAIPLTGGFGEALKAALNSSNQKH